MIGEIRGYGGYNCKGIGYYWLGIGVYRVWVKMEYGDIVTLVERGYGE